MSFKSRFESREEVAV